MGWGGDGEFKQDWGHLMMCTAFGTGFHNDGMTHLQVPVHNVMLVNVAHTLQDLINAVTAKDKGKEREREMKKIKKGCKKKKKKISLH